MGGTIYKNEHAKNNPYWFQVMVDGKRVTRRGFRTKGEAQKVRDELTASLRKGDYLDPVKQTYGEYFIEWLAGRSNIADSTRSMYMSYYRTHIQPAIGHIPLAKLHSLDMLKMITCLRDKQLSDEMVKRIFSTVNASLNSAVTMEIISKNVAAKIPKQDRPKVEKKERQIWSNESIKRLLELGKGDTRYWIAIFLAVMTGMRQGEILGLQWADLDFDKKVLYVRRNLQKDKSSFSHLKTPSSRRTISLSPLTLQVLLEQKELLAQERATMGDRYHNHDLVVPTRLGTPAKATKVLGAWRMLSEKFKPACEPDMTFHDLRHLSASIMLNEQMDIRVVSRRLGHSTVTTTLDVYSHLLPTAQENAALALDQSVGFAYVGIRAKK